MSLHPILALDHIIDEYRSYLRTEFRAKDPGLREALEQELDRPLFLAQEPFYQAHRPFRNGKRWDDLPIDPKLARVMTDRARNAHAYLHQSEAIDELLSATQRPVVVTTGTGSGKTEAFLLPVLQNAIEDAVRFKKAGLTAILVYPMNALANDQLLRIEEYLRDSGFSGVVTAERYDRGTSQAKRQEIRENPPHILLTNYMMLEYLLVRPADREAIFANHRCRYLILDEIHTYRGALGSNIALLVRRLGAHLARARQDWHTDVPGEDQAKRYPALVSVGTSATIKSLDSEGIGGDDALRRRDEAVADFFSKLTGVDPSTVRVFSEQIQTIRAPEEAGYTQTPVIPSSIDIGDPDSLRRALCRLSGLSEDGSLEDATRRCGLLWDLNRWLTTLPMSMSDLVAHVQTEVRERRDAPAEAIRRELETCLLIGAALPDGVPGALRLRAHRMIRGGWRFHRCLNPECGRLYPMGEERCAVCGHSTAPLFLCRNCGADYLRFVGDAEEGPLQPSAVLSAGPEWMVFEPQRFELAEVEEPEDEETQEEFPPPIGRGRGARIPQRMRGRRVLRGSFDPTSRCFSTVENDYPLRVVLAPARNRCLACGARAGSRNIVTPVFLGTSAALKVIAEGTVEALGDANRGRVDHDGKERLIVFSDSRQDAAHQARFVIFASRYDRMRRRTTAILEREGNLSIQRTVELLGDLGVENRDNPYVPRGTGRINREQRQRLRAWEEVPLLDDISVTAGYRGTLINLGLVGIQHDGLGSWVQERGEDIAATLGIDSEQLLYVCRCLLDEMRVRSCLSREALRYHPNHASCPSWVEDANWERRVKNPIGYPCDPEGHPLAYIDAGEIPHGIRTHNAWRRPGRGGGRPSLERILRHLLQSFGGREPDELAMTRILGHLQDGRYIEAVDLHGFRDRRRLLQVSSESVLLTLLSEEHRARCNVCGMALAFAREGFPCPKCHGFVVSWPDSELIEDRGVRRIRDVEAVPLVAGEHTAQVPNDDRVDLENAFKAPLSESRINLLACSPTLELGIDVGGLDAVALRNIPPRPDNYAQRGGRAGRRSRVGLVIGYARSTPHDQYFYDKPSEMIAGEIPPPSLALGNRDALRRHLNSIVFGAAEPGLAGRMREYVSPTGEINQEAVDGLLDGLRSQSELALDIAEQAFGSNVLAEAGMSRDDLRRDLERLPERVQDVVNRTSRQVIELRRPLDIYATSLVGRHAGPRAGDLIARLLGIPAGRRAAGAEADDRSAGYPLRRLAEFGILPGYEFPTEPAALRLLGDPHEENPLTVGRRFGIAQYQPGAQVYARKRRWKVHGLDIASPWNPQAEGPSWSYRVCRECGLRYRSDHPRCPRCLDDRPSRDLNVFEFGGFIARPDETPVLDEEERFAARNLVRFYPQWDGEVVERWSSGECRLQLHRAEQVQWLNEGPPPLPRELEAGVPLLHRGAKGYLLCPRCGGILTPPEPENAPRRGRPRANAAENRGQVRGHWRDCPLRADAPRALAIGCGALTEILRLIVPTPPSTEASDVLSWGLSLGYALRTGLRHLYMLDGPEIEFELEGPWAPRTGEDHLARLSLSFVDPSLGGTGYLQRAAGDLHLVARRALEHLHHPDCETACYRCLKSYANQRYHEQLRWPLAVPTLEALAEEPPSPRPLQVGDIDDAQPWLEAFEAGVGSPLELKFLRLFEKHDFHPLKQVPVAAREGGPSISVTDFAVPERRLAIYIDGASVHVGANLRRDRYIRDRLRNGDPPWKVIELRAKDLGEGERLVRRLAETEGE